MNEVRPSHHAAITRGQVVVLIAVVAVLLGLTIPAFVSLCTAGSNRMLCQHHLQVLGMALHARADHNGGRLPSLTDAEAGSRSWVFELLPYLGQGDVHKRFDPARPDDFRAEGGPAATREKYLLCPADRAEVGESPVYRRFAPTNYAINGMVVGRNDATMKDTFRDGTSNTILLAERLRDCSGVSPLWAWATDGPELAAFAYLPPAGGASSGMFAPDVPIRVDERGFVFGVIGSMSAKPGTVTRRHAWQSRPTADGCDPALTQTAHADAMNVLQADGSVRAVTRKMSQRTFWEAVTPAGGEQLGADW